MKEESPIKKRVRVYYLLSFYSLSRQVITTSITWFPKDMSCMLSLWLPQLSQSSQGICTNELIVLLMKLYYNEVRGVKVTTMMNKWDWCAWLYVPLLEDGMLRTVHCVPCIERFVSWWSLWDTLHLDSVSQSREMTAGIDPKDDRVCYSVSCYSSLEKDAGNC